MANKLTELMARKDRGAKLAENVLTRAFRDMLTQLSIDEDKLTTLMEVYLRNPARLLEMDAEVRDDPIKLANKLANDRGNLKKEIEKDEFTFKVFLKLIELLRLKDFRISFQGTWHDGYTIKNDYFLDPEDLENIEVSESDLISFYDEIEKRKIAAGTVPPKKLEGECTVVESKEMEKAA